MSDLNCGEIKIKLTNKKYNENAMKLIDGKLEHIFIKFIDSMYIEKNKILIITTVSKYDFPSESFINFIETFFKNSLYLMKQKTSVLRKLKKELSK